MGATICSIHGFSGLGFCCKHIRDSIDLNQYTHANEFDADFDDGFTLGRVLLCDVCLCKKKTIEGAWDEQIDMQPMCGKCISTWKAKWKVSQTPEKGQQ